MLNDFDGEIKDLVCERWGKACNMLLTDKNYKELEKKETELFHKIDDLLTEEGKDLLEKYTEIESEMDCITLDTVYKEAFKDGLKFKMMLKASSL